MRILITAGNTTVPIDRVRSLTNPFTGRTGAEIALRARARGHRVTLLTSRPQAVAELAERPPPAGLGWQVAPFHTLDDLQSELNARVPGDTFDALACRAAVSDFRVAGAYSPAEDTRFDPPTRQWQGGPGRPPTLDDRAAGKIKSDAPEVWLRLVP